jgi:hypothetical protein
MPKTPCQPISPEMAQTLHNPPVPIFLVKFDNGMILPYTPEMFARLEQRLPNGGYTVLNLKRREPALKDHWHGD